MKYHKISRFLWWWFIGKRRETRRRLSVEDLGALGRTFCTLSLLFVLLFKLAEPEISATANILTGAAAAGPCSLYSFMFLRFLYNKLQNGKELVDEIR